MRRALAITTRSWGCLALLLALAGPRAAPAQVPFGWAAGFEPPGVSGGVSAAIVFDDGTGPALYAGGVFTTAGEVAAPGIAQWDGTRWAALGPGMSNSPVLALTAFDDGTGPALYAGGEFTIAGGRSSANMGKWAAPGTPRPSAVRKTP